MQPTRNSSAKVLIYGVPYSEHSSFFELTCFALSLDWSRMIATVNVGSQNSRGKMQKWFERWEVQRKKRKEAGMSEDVVPYRSVEYW
jgi:DNA cross-link repair 1A protein